MTSIQSHSSISSFLSAFLGPDRSAADNDVLIASLSPALLSDTDKRRYRMLEALGDCALSMAVATECMRRDGSAQIYQDTRSILTSNNLEARMFVESGLSRFVTFAQGVSSGSRAGADAFEVIVGLIYNAAGMDGVVLFLNGIEFFQQVPQWR